MLNPTAGVPRIPPDIETSGTMRFHGRRTTMSASAEVPRELVWTQPTNGPSETSYVTLHKKRTKSRPSDTYFRKLTPHLLENAHIAFLRDEYTELESEIYDDVGDELDMCSKAVSVRSLSLCNE